LSTPKATLIPTQIITMVRTINMIYFNRLLLDFFSSKLEVLSGLLIDKCLDGTTQE
jgi:hypothetical protein